MAFGEKIPPFSFPATNSGIEIETYREALALKGHRLIPMYFPFVRVPLAFKAGRVDAAMTDLGEDLRAEGGHYGDSAVLYDNVLFTLKERGLSLQSPADLLPLRVVSFQGAAKRYPEWLGPLEKVGGLSEVNDQATQVRLLMVGRVDVVLSDRLIFQYFTQEVRKQGIKILPVTAHRFTVARPEDYRPVFRDAQIRDDFNAGLKQLRASGRLAQIYKQYIED
ncbi:transporter substrate-binding domain-containing protein [Inhella sp. 4Y17]|uniref:Transporter substrate-binding domain-containing protein n=2 Tax=Inhella gelatinilytica TaxID=2795030 RepID=A0A931IT70_9BURK|nr:transporter substrate-binding domain-containing protein [Inhella gelatinilytica]